MTHWDTWRTLGLIQVFWFSCCKVRDLCEWKKETHYRSSVASVGTWQPGRVDPHGIESEGSGLADTDISIAHMWRKSRFWESSTSKPGRLGESSAFCPSNYLVCLRGGLSTDIMPTTVLSPSFYRWAGKHRWGVFEKDWTGWTSFSSQDRKTEQVAVSSSESWFYEGKINKWWPQRENPAKLTQP